MKYFGTMTDDNDLVNKKYVDDKSIDIENEISDIIANEYSSSSTYASGSYVIHEGVFYRCTTAITTPEVWNSAHWTEVTVGGEFVNNRNTHNILQNLITANTQLIAGELENTANFYNPANTYNVGDYVLQSVTTQSGTKDKLFRCTTAITTPEAWNSSHWTVVNLAGEIKSNKSNIQDISNDVDELYDYTKELDRTRYGEILQFRDSKTILGLTWKWDNTDFSITGRATDSDAYYYLFNHVSFPELAIMERKMAFTGSATTPVDIASTCYLIIRFYARGSEISNASYRLNDGYVDQQITIPSNAEEFSMYLWVQQSLSTDIDYTGTLKLYGSYTGEMIGDTFNRIGEQLNETNDELSDVKSAIYNITSDKFKNALLALAQNVAYSTSNGQTIYDDIYDALYGSAAVSFISASYTPSGTIYTDDSLDVFRPDLVVTAHYDDNTSTVVTTYTLSGTLSAGTNTITVTYAGKTTTFTVAGVVDWYNIFNWSLGDNLEIVAGGGLIDNTTHDLCISHVAAQLEGRRSFVTSRGKKEYINYQTREGEGFYPIPIPETASKATITITPSTQYANAQAYQLTSSGYYLDEYIAWTQGSAVLTLTPEANKFLMISSKYDSAGTSYPTEPSALTVVFE